MVTLDHLSRRTGRRGGRARRAARRRLRRVRGPGRRPRSGLRCSTTAWPCWPACSRASRSPTTGPATTSTPTSCRRRCSSRGRRSGWPGCSIAGPSSGPADWDGVMPMGPEELMRPDEVAEVLALTGQREGFDVVVAPHYEHTPAEYVDAGATWLISSAPPWLDGWQRHAGAAGGRRAGPRLPLQRGLRRAGPTAGQHTSARPARARSPGARRRGRRPPSAPPGRPPGGSWPVVTSSPPRRLMRLDGSSRPSTKLPVR